MKESNEKVLSAALLEEKALRSIETQTLIQLLLAKGIFTAEEYVAVRQKVSQIPEIKELIDLVRGQTKEFEDSESIKKGCEGKHDN